MHPLSVEEILEELILTDTPRSDIVWLEGEVSVGMGLGVYWGFLQSLTVSIINLI